MTRRPTLSGLLSQHQTISTLVRLMPSPVVGIFKLNWFVEAQKERKTSKCQRKKSIVEWKSFCGFSLETSGKKKNEFMSFGEWIALIFSPQLQISVWFHLPPLLRLISARFYIHNWSDKNKFQLLRLSHTLRVKLMSLSAFGFAFSLHSFLSLMLIKKAFSFGCFPHSASRGNIVGCGSLAIVIVSRIIPTLP